MTSPETVVTLGIKLLKIVLNLIVLIMYRLGYQGAFLGVGGTWNLNEQKNPDAEIVASGVFVGYFIFTAVCLIGLCFASGDHKTTYTEAMMNIIGLFMWVAIGATALHYWHGYLAEHKYTHVNSERQIGLIMGALCILNGAAYLLDSALSVLFILKNKSS